MNSSPKSPGYQKGGGGLSKRKNLNPVARTILQGLYDEGSHLSMLIGMHHILKAIWNNVTDYWKKRITEATMKRTKDGRRWRIVADYHPGSSESSPPDGIVYFTRISQVQRQDVVFPQPRDLNINMMPFIMAENFSKSKLPSYLKPYWSLIKHCDLPKMQLGKIGFLTIHESYVKRNTSQRRPGLHTETPGKVCIREENESLASCVRGAGNLFYDSDTVRWGGGYCYDCWAPVNGGIYMVSNAANSCKVWNCEIAPDENGQEIIGHLGDIEHLRDYLPAENNEIMQKNVMYWLTDRTPHESLPLKEGTYRQYFRLVTSEVSIWYEDHSTANPLGVVPDPTKTMVVKGSKFSSDGVVVKKSVSQNQEKQNLSLVGEEKVNENL